MTLKDPDQRIRQLKILDKFNRKIKAFMILEDQKLDAQDHNHPSAISAQEKISIDQDAKDDNLNLTCYLCKRNRPVFAGTDDIKRLPKTSISKFVKVLRDDSLRK